MTIQYRLMANELSNPLPFSRGLYGDSGRQPTFRVLELAGILQTTLDISELLGLFMRELHGHVDFDGLRYRHPEHGIEITKGDLSAHSLTYTLIISGETLGELGFFRNYAFSQDEVHNLEDLLAALLYPLRNTLQYRSALLSALRDPLTGVNNRSAMDVVLKREVELARRQHSRLAVILLDIDYFKQINDTYGHAAGDHCLQAVAHCVADSIRGSDMLFRCGGEEFLVLCSHTEHDGAENLAERIRRHVQELSLPVDRNRRLTVSLGVADLTPDDSVASLYERADRALYKAKHGGRNRVEVA